MGDSRPPRAVLDLVQSYAYRQDGQVRIVLSDPQTEIGTNPFLVMRQGPRKLKAPATVTEEDGVTTLVAEVPGGRRLRGVWALFLNAEDLTKVRLQARLLVQGPKRPVVLLWGARGEESRLPAPRTEEPVDRPA